MDEKEKELLPEEAETEKTVADGAEVSEDTEADSAKELYEELEEIKDMFQEELNKATERAEQGELIQELTDFEEEQDEEDTPEEDLCECCGENPKATEFGENYAYCTDCRQFMKRYPIRKSGILMAIIMFIVFVGTVATSSLAVDANLQMLDGYVHYTDGKLISAMQSYYYYLSSADSKNVSMTAVNQLIDCYSRTGYMSDAVTLINQYYSERDLKMPWNSKYRKIVEETESNTNTYYAVSEVVAAPFSGEEYDYDEVMANLTALREETDEEGNRLYTDLFIDYFTYELMRLHDEPLVSQLEYLKEMDKNHKGNEWVYLATLCATAAKTGDAELTESAYKRLIEINKEDQNAYLAYANYYRFLETPDADKMIEIASEAAVNAMSGDMTYKQYLAIAYLLKGEGSMALEEMEDFMSSGSYNVAQCNLYALTALYNGNTEIYESMKELLETNGYELSELVEKYKDKEMTIEEVLKDKGGDI